MQNNSPEVSKIIEFKLPPKPLRTIASRNELAQMVKRVLIPAELFKLNAPKRQKTSGEIIDFTLPSKESKTF